MNEQNPVYACGGNGSFELPQLQLTGDGENNCSRNVVPPWIGAAPIQTWSARFHLRILNLKCRK